MSNFGFSTTGNEVVQHFHERVKGKTVLITGASVAGLGAETAISLASGSPAHIILLARSASKVDPVIQEIEKAKKDVQAIFVPVELDKPSSIARAAEQIKSNPAIEKIDIVINNAGIMATPYQKNEAGIESQLATNHIGHFLLVKLLQPLIASPDEARIVNVTSNGYQISAVRFEDHNFSDGKTYDPWSGYGQSKTANMLFTRYMAQKLANKGVTSFSVHPGVIWSTSLAGSIDPTLFNDIPAIAKRNTGAEFVMEEFKSAQQGVATTLVAALDPGLANKSGSYLKDCNVAEELSYASSLEDAEKLWKLSEKLTGGQWDLSMWP